ncbi:MAG: Hint domain-containing protein [Pseudomonadota bacterium]
MIGFFFIDASQVTSAPLGNSGQGDGSQHDGGTITIAAGAVPEWITLTDDDGLFQDSDGGQRIDGTQTVSSATFVDGQDVEAEYTVVVTDGVQNYTLYGVSTGAGYSNVVGLAFLGDFPPFGPTLSVVSTSEGPRGNTSPTYDDLAQICFVPGTLILTEAGPREVETLRPGDLVITKDRGPQPLRWTTSSKLDAARLERDPHLKPVVIRKGALGPGLPARDLVVSPNHRIALDTWRAELLFGSKQVLVTAKSLADGHTIFQDQSATSVTYHHILFEQHEIVTAHGVPTESFQPTAPVLDALGASVREELFEIFPDLRSGGTQSLLNSARPTLRANEAAILNEMRQAENTALL